jgi:hypothetical protein
MIEMALGVSGEVAMKTANHDTITRITADPADRWMKSGRESRPARNLLTSYTVRSHTKKTITSCSETVAELDCRVEKQMRNEGIFMRRAVPFLFVLVLLGVKSCTIPRQSCAANERSGRGAEQVYISRGAPSREPKKSSLHLSELS